MEHAGSSASMPGAGNAGSVGEEFALRSRRPADEAFLLRVYASTREQELALTGWGDAEKQAFLAMQFQAQDRHYREYFPAARCDIVEVAGQAAGRFYVDRGRPEFVLLDIALLPAYCGRGIGGRLLRALQRDAEEVGSAIVIHVERTNRARELYLRLGFVPVEDVGLHIKMRWLPDNFTDGAAGMRRSAQ